MNANEKSAVAEATTPLPITQPVGVTQHPQSISAVTSRQVAWFRAFLADYIERYRAVNGTELEIDESELCRRGCGRFAQYNSECFACGREQWS